MKKKEPITDEMRNRQALALLAVFLVVYVVGMVPRTREAALAILGLQSNVASSPSVASVGDIFGLTHAVDPKDRTDACIGITNIIQAGTSDMKSAGEVTKLQQFLKDDKNMYPEGLVTGFAGPATVRAIKRYQAGKGLAKEGDKNYGIVETKTQQALTHDMCVGVVGSAGVEAPTSYLTAKEAQTRVRSATPNREGLAILQTHVATTSGYGMGGNYYAGTDGRTTSVAPRILGIIGPRMIDVGQIAIWHVDARSADNTPLTYAAYWGTASEASLTTNLGNLTEGKNAMFSTVFEAPGAHEIIFAVKSKAGVTAYQSVVVSVGKVSFRGGSVTFDIRDAGERCPNLLPTCDRLSALTSANAVVGSLSRYFADTPQFIGTSVQNRDGFLSWQSLPAGQYEATFAYPGFLPYTEKFSINRGEQKQLKISLERLGAKKPQLIRLVPEAGFYGDFVVVVGNNLSTADKILLGGHYIGFLDTKDNFYGFTIPRTDTPPPSCNGDFLLSTTCAGRYRYDFRPGSYSVQLQNEIGTSTKATLQIFEKSKARPFSPAVMTELLKNTPTTNQFVK